MLNTILLSVLIYIIITILVNLMVFYVNDEFKDLNKFNLFYFIIVYIFSSFTARGGKPTPLGVGWIAL